MCSRVALFVCLSVFACTSHAREFVLGDNDSVIGELSQRRVSAEQTLLDVGQSESLGYIEMALANPAVDMWLPDDDAEVLLPQQFVLPQAPRFGVVLNLAEYRLYYFPKNDATRVLSYPASIGRMDWETPLGRARIVAKAKDPSWYPPASVRAEHRQAGDSLPAVVPPGPDNPLGRYALRLSIPGYLIHGTNKPAGVGMRVTHGCLRLFPDDIASLFSEVRVGTPVHIINQPIKFGWRGDDLLLEVHPPLASGGHAADEPEPGPLELGRHTLTDLTRAVASQLAKGSARIDWTLAEATLLEANGVPVVIGQRNSTEAVDARVTLQEQ